MTMWEKIRIALCVGLGLVGFASAAHAQTQAILPNGMTQFSDGNGAPYAGGRVYMYVPFTTTPKATYQDPNAKVPNQNPVTLDANGRGIMWGSGEYRQVLQDSNGNVVWDQLTFAAGAASGETPNTLWYGTAVGTANSITLTGPTGFNGTDGQEIGFVANATNTGTATINPNGYGSVLVEKNTTAGPIPLTGMEIGTGSVYYATYVAGINAFVLQTSLAPVYSLLSPGPQLSGISALAVYQKIVPNVTVLNVLPSVLDVPAGSTIISQSAIAGYFRNKSGGSGAVGNAAGLMSVGTCEADNTACWGIRAILQDSGSRITGTGAGRVLTGYEFDANVMETSTYVYGVDCIGSSLATPTISACVAVYPLGTGLKWGSGLLTADAGAAYAMIVGASTVAAASVNSQPIAMRWYDSGSTGQIDTIVATPLGLQFAGSGTWQGIAAIGGSFYLDKTYGVYLDGNRELATNSSDNVLFGDGTNPIILETITTGVPSASVCLNSTNVIVIKTTSGACI